MENTEDEPVTNVSAAAAEPAAPKAQLAGDATVQATGVVDTQVANASKPTKTAAN